MRPVAAPLSSLLVAIVVLARPAAAQEAAPVATPSPATPPATPPAGCYRADRPIGTVGPSTSRRGSPLDMTVAFDDSTSHYFRLDSAGRASRRMLSRGGAWWDRSRWEVTGDTLVVRLASGTVAWNLELVGDHRDGRYAGMATYLSDAVVRGSLPPRVPLRVRPAPCPPPPSR